MEKDIRDFFRAERRRLKLTQKTVATAGQLEQSTISKIERDAPYEPSVSIFVKAVRGLGMTPAVFFARFEGRDGRTGAVMVDRSQKTLLQLPDALADNRLTPQTREADDGADSLSTAVPTISQDDLVKIFRVFRKEFGVGVLEVLSDFAATRRKADATRRKRSGNRSRLRRDA